MKIGIIGAGFVGSTTAYTLAMKGNADEIVLIDLNSEKAQAEALDVYHAASLTSRCKVFYGDYPDLKDADIVIITVDSKKTLDGDRMVLLAGNTAIIKSIVPNIVRFAPDCIILTATNPVDVMTKMVKQISGFPKERVIGSGTVLDTARFRAILSERLGHISPTSIHAYVLGEHGKTSLVAWSGASIGGAALDEYAKHCGVEFTLSDKQQIADEVLDAGFKIYRGKKATYYGIAASLSAICEAIIKDQQKEMLVSSLQTEVFGIKDVCLSLPTIVGRKGAERSIIPALSDAEKQILRQSAEAIAAASQEASQL
ncbi:MAG: L-lactate dehydrogenase [Alphaproteobacteria bacterium]|nr:L-lactate dehydrogenase [Alphaproteobacteria bacterium]